MARARGRKKVPTMMELFRRGLVYDCLPSRVHKNDLIFKRRGTLGGEYRMVNGRRIWRSLEGR